MATRRKSSPYAMSANLGSGVRTTTGGSYTNPRFGIEDYTAFGRGVASTFRVPEEEEQKVAELELPTIDYIGAQKDAMLGDTQWMENSNLVNQLTSDLQPLKLQYAKCTKANDQQCLNNISTTLNVIRTGQAQFQNMLTKYADSEIMDPETSRGQYMIGTDKKNIRRPDGSFLSLSDITKVNNESPKDITMAVVDGKAVYKVKLDGTSYNVNLSDLTENYLTNNFDIRSDIGLDVQTAMSSGGFTSDWKDEPTYMNDTSKLTTETGEVSVTEFEDYKGIVQGLGYFNKAEDKSKVFSRNIYKTISSPNVNSAFNNLTAKIYNGSFKSDEIKNFYAANPQLKTPKDLNDFRKQVSAMPNGIKLSMLQDEAEQEWLIANASNGYRRGDDGRAERLDENYLIKTSKTTKPITEGEGSSFNVEDVSDLSSEIKSYFKGVFENFELNELTDENVEKNRLLNMTIDHPVYGKGQITDVGATEGMLRIGITTKDRGFEPETNYVTYNSGDVEDLLDHTSYFNLPLLQGQSNAKNRDSLLRELNK